jgi:hypothetical protein
VLAAGLLLHAALAVTSMRTTSAVYDETAHLPAGYSYLTQRDFRMNPEHPPLVKELAALPLLFMDVRARMGSEPWRGARQWEFGNRFLYHWNDGDRLLFRGRLAVVALACALGASVLLWTWRRFGPVAGAVALLLCVLSPDVLAHGQIVTTDLAVALFMFSTVVAFQAVTERVTVTRVLLAGLAAGAAFASKFSAFVLMPILAVLTIVIALSPDPVLVAPPGGTPRAVSGAARKFGVLSLVLLAMGAVAVALVWAAYAFEPRLANDPQAALAFNWARIEQRGLASGALRTLRSTSLLPDAYVYGLLTVLRDSESRPAFLFGDISDRGWWYYFPATFLLKTPLALLGILALPLLSRRPEKSPFRGARLFLWLPVLIYVAATLTRNLNIGHRHLLPIYPFLFAAGGAATASALAAGGARRWAAAALCAWYAGSVVSVHPHYLAYFNELGGGPSGGWRYLVDSNVDWGQDLKALKRWTETSGVSHLKLSYFGTGDPAYYGISCEMLPSKMHPDPPRIVREIDAGEVVAVSVTNLHGVYFTPEERRFMRRLRDSTPVGRAGYSIFIYRPDFSASVRGPN